MTGPSGRGLAPAVLATTGYVVTIPAANWLTTHCPPVAMAMAGGVILSSWTASESVATAAAAAYAFSESLDFIVYERLRARGFMIALALSNATGVIAGSLLFLWLVFGSLHCLPGQVIGKTWMTAAAVALLLLRRRRRRGGHLLAYGSLESVPGEVARPVRDGERGDGFGPSAGTQAQPRDAALPKALP